MADPGSGNACLNATNVFEDNVQRRFPRRERRKLARFKINASIKVRSEDESTVRSDISGERHDAWRAAMKSEVPTLENIGCWDVLSTPKKTTF